MTTAAADSKPAFSGTIAATALPRSYRLGLLLVSVAMILVPLLYLLLVVAVGWALAWHLTANTWLFGSSLGQVRLLAYLAPAVAGTTLLFFMVKPILARRPKGRDPVQVLERDQPRLHALIRDLSAQIGAPVPARVYVDCQVNAAAALSGGLTGLFGRNLDLTIGLPLVTGLSVRQLSGVVAHELGHFAQGGGMRMTVLIRSINGWLFRVVHERDSWDQRLDEWSRDGDVRVVIPMALARASVWLSRLAVSGVAMVGHGVSCYMMRQMEFDADSYEVKIAGSETFAQTVVRLRELSAGSQLAYSQLSALLERRALPADMPRFVADCSGRLPYDLRAQVQKISDLRSGAFDTHPSDASRIAAAAALETTGVLVGGEELATALFDDFDRLTAVVTRHHYEHDLNIDLDALRFLAVDEASQGVEHRQRTEAALQETFAARVSVTRPLRVRLQVWAGWVGDLDDTLDRARAAVSGSTLSDESYRAFEQLQDRRDLAFCAEQLFDAGVQTLDAKQFALSEPTLAGARAAQAWALQEQEKLRHSLDAFDELIDHRLGLGVLLAERDGHGEEARAAALALTTLSGVVHSAVDARRLLMASALLEDALPAVGPSLNAHGRAGHLAAALDTCRANVLDGLRQASLPGGELSDDWQRLRSDAAQLPNASLMQRVFELYWVTLSRLVRVVADAEAEAAAKAPAAVTPHSA
jgi:Zn-dependent protease with chaperone function